MWRFIISIESVPQDRDLMLAVVDQDGFARNDVPMPVQQ